MKTSKLTGAALDYAVAIAEGGTDFGFDGITHGFKLNGRMKVLATGWALTMSYHPSTNWAQGGPIMAREIDSYDKSGDTFQAVKFDAEGNYSMFDHIGHHGFGPSPLIAAMRCYVASKLGDEVDVPKELL